MTSDKQIEANQENAKKGGVKTDQGKEKSKYNALQHGILSKETIIRRGDLKESEEEYVMLRDQFLSDVHPVGTVELMLADKLFTLYWRERRMVKAERALVEIATIGHRLDRIPKYQDDNATRKLLGGKPRLTPEEWRQVDDVAMTILGYAEEKDYPLPTSLLEQLAHMTKIPHVAELATQIYLQSDVVRQRIEKSGKEWIQQNPLYFMPMLGTAKKLAELTEKLATETEQNIHDEEDASVDMNAMPWQHEMIERMQRYESHLHRTFMNTLHELQRIQSARLDKPSPTAALDVTINGNENGFVS